MKSQASNQKMKYYVSVKTGDKMNAGTDSNIALSIIGNKWSLESFPLDAKASKKKKNLFEKGNLDEFEFETNDVGKIDRVKIGHDGVKLGSSWFLESLTIRTSNETQTWTVNKWLDKDDGTNSIELRAVGGANDKSNTKSSSPSKKEQKENKENIAVQNRTQRDASRPKNAGAKVNYIVTVKSGNKSSGANSNSTLTLSVYGNKNALEEVKLNSQLGGKSKGLFERNSVDEFQFEEKDVGKLDRIKIGHDFAKLHLEYISIKTPAEIKTWTVNKIVEKSTPIELKSEQETSKKPTENAQKQQQQQKESKNNIAVQKSQKPEAKSSSMKYLITIKTGNKMGAGTDSNVTMSIYGTKASLQSLVLDASKSTKQKKNLFEKGSADEFEISGNDVGKLTGIKIGHDGVGMASTWLLESVTIKTSGESRTWIIDKWLDKDDGGATIELKDSNSKEQQQKSNKKSDADKEKQKEKEKQTAQKPVQKQEEPQKTKTEEKPDSPRKVADDKDSEELLTTTVEEAEKPEKKTSPEPVLDLGLTSEAAEADVEKEKPFESDQKEKLIVDPENTETLDKSTQVDADVDKIENPKPEEKPVEKETIVRYKDKEPEQDKYSVNEGDEVILLPISRKQSRKSQDDNRSDTVETPKPRFVKSVRVHHHRRRFLYINDYEIKKPIRKSYEPKPPKNTEESIKIELRQLRSDLEREKDKFQYPRRKSHRPYVFNDLYPYSDINQLEDLVYSPEKLHPVGYYTRFTATGIVEPWVAHRMEHSVAPLSSRSTSHSLLTNRAHVEAKGKSDSDRPSKDQITGSTLAPNYPKVVVKKPKNLNGPFYFNDVAAIREEVKNNINSKTRFDEDRNRTINDYYRMNLDQTVDNEKMTQAYNAYLSNTPGSKQALTELLNKDRDEKTTAEKNDEKHSDRSDDSNKNKHKTSNVSNKVEVEAN